MPATVSSARLWQPSFSKDGQLPGSGRAIHGSRFLRNQLAGSLSPDATLPQVPVPQRTVFATDVLVIDGTNISCAASADTLRWRLADVPKAVCLRLWVDYLTFLTKPRVTIAVFDGPQDAVLKRRVVLDPNYLRRRRARSERRPRAQVEAAGGHPARQAAWGEYHVTTFTAKDGYEADDYIGAMCTLLSEAGSGSTPLRITVASGDSDFQQLLGKGVSWLNTQHSHKSLRSRPLQLDWVTADSFYVEHGFTPAQYHLFLALAGKAEANLRGAGVGARVGATLLEAFGSLTGILEAADQGLLKAFKHQAQLLFQPTDPDVNPRLAALMSTAKLLCIERDPAILGSAVADSVREMAHQLVTAKQQAPAPEKKPRKAPSPKLAWLHPMFRGRLLYNKPHIDAACSLLKALGVSHTPLYTTSEGLPLDITLSDELKGWHSGEKRGLVVCGKGDFIVEEGIQVWDDAESGVAVGVRMKQLNNAAHRVVSALRKCGWRIVCIKVVDIQRALEAPEKAWAAIESFDSML